MVEPSNLSHFLQYILMGVNHWCRKCELNKSFIATFSTEFYTSWDDLFCCVRGAQGYRGDRMAGLRNMQVIRLECAKKHKRRGGGVVLQAAGA